MGFDTVTLDIAGPVARLKALAAGEFGIDDFVAWEGAMIAMERLPGRLERTPWPPTIS